MPLAVRASCINMRDHFNCSVTLPYGTDVSRSLFIRENLLPFITRRIYMHFCTTPGSRAL
jgi:hypothetical protein